MVPRAKRSYSDMGFISSIMTVSVEASVTFPLLIKSLNLSRSRRQSGQMHTYLPDLSACLFVPIDASTDPSRDPCIL